MGKLSKEYEEKLVDLGYSFTKNHQGETTKKYVKYEEIWNQKFDMLIKFHQKHKSFIIPASYHTLHLWVRSQRKQYRENTLEESRIKKLDSIGFDWISKQVVTPRDDSKKWNAMFDKLKSFREINRHCNVPRIYEGNRALDKWVNDQRNRFNKGTLNKERIDLLNRIDFIWDKKEFNWNKKLQLLQDFYKKYNHFDVRPSDKGFEGLYHWLYKIEKEGVSIEQRAKLESIGYKFIEYNPDNWFELFAKLAKHKEAVGDFTFKDKQDPIAKWFNNQKNLISRKELPKDKIEILCAIGLNLEDIPKPRKRKTKNSATWEEMLEMLKEYHKVNGHYNVPKKYPENPKLSKWIYYQKSLKRNNKLEAEKIKALENIGFEFPKPLKNQKSWKERFEELLEYKAKNGDCQVPVRFKENQQLATWVRTQRRYFKEGTIEVEKKQKLENIGFIWRVNK